MSTFSDQWCAKCGDARRAPSHAYCRRCRNEYQNGYRRYRYKTELAYRQKARAANRSRLYGVSEDRHTELWAQQGGVCAICLLDDEAKGLGVDHDHETGAVRGLLCQNCNGAIGMLRERQDLLVRAGEYLQ